MIFSAYDLHVFLIRALLIKATKYYKFVKAMLFYTIFLLENTFLQYNIISFTLQQAKLYLAICFLFVWINRQNLITMSL